MINKTSRKAGLLLKLELEPVVELATVIPVVALYVVLVSEPDDIPTPVPAPPAYE